MSQVIYGLILDHLDGSNGMAWFRNKTTVDKILDDHDFKYQEFYGNQDQANIVLTFPPGLDLVACGFQFSDDQYR